jgi:antitoxin HicB
MYNFDDYTIVVRKTPEEYHNDLPERKYVAFLKEIPEASLHEYGKSRKAAIDNLEDQFEELKQELLKKGEKLPEPEGEKEEEYYSGKLVLRLPRWLHRKVSELSETEGVSLNSYLVNQLIRNVTIDEVVKPFRKMQYEIYTEIFYNRDNMRFQIAETTQEKMRSNISGLRGKSPQYKLRRVV